jgi:hypothetical protein
MASAVSRSEGRSASLNIHGNEGIVLYNQDMANGKILEIYSFN